MTPIRSATLILIGASTLGLTACGEGWEARPYRDRVPYTEERTAGPGVEYVRAFMLPERGPNLETPALKGTETPILDAGPMFEPAQRSKK